MGLFDFLGNTKQYNQIIVELNLIQRRLDKMSGQEAELDADLQAENTKLADLETAVLNLIANLPPGVDLTDEIAAVNAALGKTAEIETDVEGATPAPPTGN